MIWTKLVFGGFGRRGFEAIVAGLVLVLTTAVVAGSLMVVEGARDALSQAERNDRPDVIQVKGRFNRAVFETPRSGHLPPATLPIYEPLIDPETLIAAAGGATRLVIPGEMAARIDRLPMSFMAWEICLVVQVGWVVSANTDGIARTLYP